MKRNSLICSWFSAVAGLAFWSLCAQPMRADGATPLLAFDAQVGLAEPTWQKTGEIEIKTTKDGEISALDFDDDSTKGRLTYTASLKPMAEELQKGFVLELTAKMLSGRANMIALSLPSARFLFTFSASEKEQLLGYSSSAKSGSVSTPVGEFHNWKIVYRPAAAGATDNGGQFAVFLDGEKKIESIGALKGNGQATLALGSVGNYSTPDRVGRVLIQKFALRPATESD